MGEVKKQRKSISPERQRLHKIFVNALGDSLFRSYDLEYRPFIIETKRPFVETFNVYLYPAINPPGGRHASEYKINLLLQNHKPQTKGNFNSDNYPLLVSYCEEFDVYILLDAFAHKDFTPNTNVQFRDDVIYAAMLNDLAYMTKDNGEVVIAATAPNLIKAIQHRVFDTKPPHGVS